MSHLVTRHNPRCPWLSPRLVHPHTGVPVLHGWWYLWYHGDPWPDCLAGHHTAVRGLWVVVYDICTQRHQIRALRAVAGTPAARPPYLCHPHAHAQRQQCAAVRIPPQTPQPLSREDFAREDFPDRLARLAREDAEDVTREARLLAWNAWRRQRAQALAAAAVAAPDWHRPAWFRPLRVPRLPATTEET